MATKKQPVQRNAPSVHAPVAPGVRIPNWMMTLLGASGYALMFLATYGHRSASYQDIYNKCMANRDLSNWALCVDPVSFFDPLIAGIFWPIYWLLHLATKAFM